MLAPVMQADTARAAQICMKSPSAAKIPVTKRKVPTISAMLAARVCCLCEKEGGGRERKKKSREDHLRLLFFFVVNRK